MTDEYRCPENQRFIFIGEHFDAQKKKAVRLYKARNVLIAKSRVHVRNARMASDIYL
jgi:hypothetical protein